MTRYPPALRLVNYVPFLAFLSVTSLACRTQKIPKSQRSAPSGKSSQVYADLQGMSAEDRTDAQLSYHLHCDGDLDVQGTIIEAQNERLLSFQNESLREGLACAIEVKGPMREGLEWLTKDHAAGVYYASTKSAIKDRRLFVTLYKVYRESITNGAQSLTVQVEEGGLCETFDRQARTCQPTNGAGAVMARFGLAGDFDQGSFIVTSLENNSILAQAGLRLSDRIVAIGDVKASDQATVEKSLTTWEAKVPREPLPLSVVRSNEVIFLMVK